YRTKDEVQKWRQRDPIGLLEHKLLERGVIDEDDIDEIRDDMKETVDEIVEFADESEEPPLDELYTDVYAGEDEHVGEEE
ncbi:MAG: thiamine pyrophosphate-dependent enzyme, partial [Actinomycetota bacterium]|nr:thiamine pyrophosphate-dependent enzyme [Actinomycetota bacterium]